MGGTGAGHKSVAAREARLVNIQKARAARKRAPLPWRSGMESRIIEQLVWQWWVQSSGEWPVTLRHDTQGRLSGEQAKATADSRHGGQASVAASFVHVPLSRQTGTVPRNGSLAQRDSASRPPWRAGAGAASSAPTNANGGRKGSGKWSVKSARNCAGRPWAKVRVARFLGVSHTWVNKLVKKFEADPERMRRKMAAFAPASIEKLERAREETRWEREHGRLREPIRYRRMKVEIQGKKTGVVAATRVERQRRQEEIEGERARLRGEKNQQQIPHTATRRPVRNDNAFLAYREVPEWAKGLLLPGDPGTVRSGPFVPQGKRTPRPVPFAFRRKR